MASKRARRAELAPLPPVERVFPYAILFFVVFFYEWIQANVTLANDYEDLVRKRHFDEGVSGLRDSWLTPVTGRRMDTKDAQWYGFRNGLPYLTALFTFFVGLRYVVPQIWRNPLGLLMSLGYVVYLHAPTGAAVMILVALAHFFVVKLSRKYLGSYSGLVVEAPSWLFCLGFLFGSKATGGYREWLPAISALTPWHHCFNLTVLRLLSFTKDAEAKDLELTAVGDYLLYVFYAPLHLTGPICSFEDFARPAGPVGNEPSKARYGLRLLFSLLCFEVFSTYFYSSALTKFFSANPRYVAEVAQQHYRLLIHGAFASLFFLWFKFLIIWRFARFFALLDGVDAPENMRRCVANNYSVRGFWKDWHCSFNAWLVKHVYVPLGGSRGGLAGQAFAVASAFAFVAAWHDLEWRLALWGACFSVMILPEILASKWAATSATALGWQARRPVLWRWLAALAGGVAIVGLQVVNMLGYALGVEGVRALTESSPLLRTWEGRGFVLRWWLTMSVGAFLMMRIREWEADALDQAKKADAEAADAPKSDETRISKRSG